MASTPTARPEDVPADWVDAVYPVTLAHGIPWHDDAIRIMLAAAWPHIAAQERAEERSTIVADLKRAAAGRHVVADAIDNPELLAEANVLDAAAKLAGGDHTVMIALIPSWLWTDADADRNPMPDLIPAGPPMREDPILSCVRCQDRPAADGSDFCRPCIDEVVGRDAGGPAAPDDPRPKSMLRRVDFDTSPEPEPAVVLVDRRRYEDLLGSIWLYISWRSVTRKLTTEQKNLFADAVEAAGARMGIGHPDQPLAVDRWWRDDAPLAAEGGADRG